MNPTIELLKSHRSIRKFKDQKIPRELFEDLIRAGQCAATSNHVQAYTIIHVVNPESRRKLAELAGGQTYVESCSDFLVFCADMKRATESAAKAGAEVIRGMTEQLLVASIDTALIAQNVVVAAESEGLGICYIGGIRNNPQEVSNLLKLPEHVYPVFGLCLGYPDQQPEVKPRLPWQPFSRKTATTTQLTSGWSPASTIQWPAITASAPAATKTPAGPNSSSRCLPASSGRT